jgi:hypothetical protein
MAVAWTTIPNGDVDVDSPLSTALITSLRDNLEGVAQRATGAPKIFGVPYNFQEFTTNGTWNKPSDAETGDIVVVEIVGGGQSGNEGGTSSAGGDGGTGYVKTYDIDDLGATASIVVGAGGSGSSVDGTSSIFDNGDAVTQLSVNGGGVAGAPSVAYGTAGDEWGGSGKQGVLYGVGQAGANSDIALTIWGGGGGGGQSSSGATLTRGAPSTYHGAGGDGADATAGGDGKFPGGGGGGSRSGGSGDGADGVVRVYCIKRGN